MTLILSGTDGLSDIDGSAATPAIRGTDANTGIYFPSADVMAVSAGGIEVGRFNSTGFVGSSIQSDTAKSATSTAVDFTSIPSWVKRITVMFQGVSTTGTSQPMFQLGDSGGIETTGYTTVATSITTVANSATSYTNGWQIFSSNSARVIEGNIVFSLINASTNTWSGSGQFSTELPSFLYTVGTKSLSATLDRVRITTAGGTDTFDAGTINILYE